MKSRPLPHKVEVFVCCNSRPKGERVSCGKPGGEKLRERLKDLVKKHKLKGKVRVSSSGCMDVCEKGPNVMIFPDNVWYQKCSPDDAEAIFEAVLKRLEADAPKK